jgi:dTMP kinase
VFISFEGIEASGKSTLMAAIERALRAEGHEVVVTREPGGTPVGNSLRQILLDDPFSVTPVSEMLMMNASRSQLVTEVIRPALARGAVVLCDRYMHSSLAYQGYGRGLPLELVRSVCDAATGGLMPDLVLLVDISPETSRERLAARGDGHDRMEREDDAFHRRVREGYLEIDAAMAALTAVLTGGVTFE